MSVAAGRIYDTVHDVNITPFRPETDAAFFFRAHSHVRAFEYLRKSIQEGRELAVIHGRSGLGKTMVSRMVAEDATRYGALTAYVNIVADEGDGTLRAVCPSLGFTRAYVDMALFLARIQSFAEQGHRGGLPTLLFIDNAHRLEAQTLARLLEQTRERDAMATVLVLVGLDPLEANMQHVLGEQVSTVNVTIHEISPLTTAETASYVEHYLDIAASPIGFEAEALARIHEITNGIPKRINGICDRLVLRATLDGVTKVDAAMVEEVYGATVLNSRTNSNESDVARLLHGLGLSGGPHGERPVAQPDAEDAEPAPIPPTPEPIADIGIAHVEAPAEHFQTEPDAAAQNSDAVAPINTRRGRNLMLASAAAVVLASAAYFFYQQERPAPITTAFAPEAQPEPIKRDLAIPAPETQNGSHSTAISIPKAAPKKASVADKSPPKSAHAAVAKAPKPAAKPAAVKIPRAHNDEPKPKAKRPVVQASAASQKTTKASVDSTAKTGAATKPMPVVKAVSSEAPKATKPAIAHTERHNVDVPQQAKADAVAPVASNSPAVVKTDERATDNTLKANTGDVVAKAATTLATPPPVPVPAIKVLPDPADQPVVNDEIPRDTLRGINQAQLDGLMLRFTSSYRQGDIDTFVSLFRDNAYTNESANAAQIRDEYAQLFKLSESRSLEVEDLKWSPLGDDGLQGNGKFVAEVTLQGAQPQTFSGQLFIEVRAENGKPRIAALFHKYAKTAATE